MLAAVEVAFESDAILGNLAQIGQAHHLIAAAVGQDRAIPVHEFVQAPKPRDPFSARTQHQVIGIAEQDVRPG